VGSHLQWRGNYWLNYDPKKFYTALWEETYRGQAYYASELVMNLKSFIVLMALGLCEKWLDLEWQAYCVSELIMTMNVLQNCGKGLSVMSLLHYPINYDFKKLYSDSSWIMCKVTWNSDKLTILANWLQYLKVLWCLPLDYEWSNFTMKNLLW